MVDVKENKVGQNYIETVFFNGNKNADFKEKKEQREGERRREGKRGENFLNLGKNSKSL